MLHYVNTPCTFEVYCSSSTPTSTCTVVEKIWCVNSLDVNIAIRVTSLIVSYVFNYGYRSLLVAEDSPFLKNHTVSLL